MPSSELISEPATTVLPVHCDDLTRVFASGNGVHACSLSVRDGAAHALMGPNGSGKSTLLRLLTGLLRPDGGRAELYGADVAHNHARALRDVGASIDFPAFYREHSGAENLAYIARLRGLPASAVDDALKRVNLQRARHQTVRVFDGYEAAIGPCPRGAGSTAPADSR